MTDRRFLRSNGRIACATIAGEVEAETFVTATPMRCKANVTDLCASANGPRDKQLLLGQAFHLLDIQEGWAFGYDPVDGYVGYVEACALTDPLPLTHRVFARSSHLYSRSDFKAPELTAISFLSEVTVTGEEARFYHCADGSFLPKTHAQPLAFQAKDVAGVAELFLGTPYLWGGNSGFGIDCSGLVQLALAATGTAAPRDSDLQENTLGTTLPPDSLPQRGDLFFWKGHVAMATDSTTLIHANAHHMAVAKEPITDAVNRIQAQGSGPVTRRARLGSL